MSEPFIQIALPELIIIGDSERVDMTYDPDLTGDDHDLIRIGRAFAKREGLERVRYQRPGLGRFPNITDESIKARLDRNAYEVWTRPGSDAEMRDLNPALDRPYVYTTGIGRVYGLSAVLELLRSLRDE